ncbi:hypothetical protein EDC94DRAFT_646933 [Helicostylum pulchrum]|nr:hypothetical protein EDC94DRAFT_646933 [Helicostylum pulchrum]
MRDKKTAVQVYRDEPIEPSSSKIIHWFGFDRFEPERAVTSHFVTPKTLFFIRLPLVLYNFIVLWVDIIWTIKSGGFRQFFAYFTDLTFIGLHIYQMITLYHHAKYLWLSKADYTTPKRPSSLLDQSPVLNYLYVYLYHTIIVYNIQTPVVFWALLANEKLFNAHLSPIDFWISISLHAVTLFVLLVEVIFNRMIIYINMVLLVYITVLLYMCMTFIIFAVEQWWVYSFLDWRVGPSAAIWYIAISVIIIICFFFQVLVHKLRDFIAKKLIASKCCAVKQNSAGAMDTAMTKPEKSDVVHQNSNFEPLASTIGGGSRITFGDSLLSDHPVNESAVYF